MLTEQIVSMRKGRKLTQRQLAEMMHVSVSAVQKWERGQAEPNAKALVRMADIFAVTLDELCDRVPPETNTAAMIRAFKRLNEEEQAKLIAMGKLMYGHAFSEK